MMQNKVRLLNQLREEQPLVHCITNSVVANFQANGLLALGASPIMADAGEEAAEIAALSACTVLNIGTLKQETIESMCLAGKSAVQHGKPVVIDPVGVGATAFRQVAVLRILNEVDVSLIRCNAGELAAIAGVPWQVKGVDAGKGEGDITEIAKTVANQFKCLVAVSGATDIVTDGTDSIYITGGDPLMTRVTGMGCLLSAVTGAFLAISDDSGLNTLATALAFYKRAGEKAKEKSSGPGDFAVNFINALYLVEETDLFIHLKGGRTV